MRLGQRIRGQVQVELCGAEPTALLNACIREGIRLCAPEATDAYTLRAAVDEGQLPRLEAAAARCMCQLRVLSRRGGSRDRRFLRRRAVLLLAGLLCALLLACSSLFIWEIEVVGCETVSRGRILRELADCGVESGCFWPGLSADLLRSRMLRRVPELQWLTVNVSGSRATVLVEERAEKPEIYRESGRADLTASRDGLITRMTVRNGRALVSVGETVLEGQTLVSGRMESLSHPAREVRALGEVWADTWHEHTAVYPLSAEQKGAETVRLHRFALKLGKSRINLGRIGKKDLDGYDKIVHEYTVGRRGLFALPIRLLHEELVGHALSPARQAPEEALRRALLEGLEADLDGEIVTRSFTASREKERVLVTLRAQCSENIATLTEET